MASILVIEKEKGLQKLLARLLTGYQVTGRQPEDDLKRNLDLSAYDLIVADIMMPEMAGIEILLEIRQCSSVPILMLSTFGAGRDEVRCLDLNSGDYLSRPLSVDQITGKIKALVNGLRICS